MKPRVLVFAGSAREGSLNKQLARAAAAAVEKAGGEATFIDLGDFPMPVYDGDLEAASGVPETAQKLKELFKAHQALVIASPENNASVSALLKNTLDWVSREWAGESGTVPYRGKVAVVMAASPGAIGGLRALPHLRAILETLQVTVLPQQLAVGRADQAFGGDGRLRDERQQATLESACKRLVELAAKLA